MCSRFPKQLDIVKFPCVGSKVEWCMAVVVSQMNGGTLGEELPQDCKRRRGRRNVLFGGVNVSIIYYNNGRDRI